MSSHTRKCKWRPLNRMYLNLCPWKKYLSSLIPNSTTMFTTTPSLIQQLRTWRDVSRQPERQTPASKEEVLTTDHKRYIFIPAATTRKNVFRPFPVEWLDCNHDICIRKVTCWFFYRKLKPVWRNFFQLPIYSWSQRGPGSPLGMCEVTKNKLFVCRPISHWNPPPKNCSPRKSAETKQIRPVENPLEK